MIRFEIVKKYISEDIIDEEIITRLIETVNEDVKGIKTLDLLFDVFFLSEEEMQKLNLKLRNKNSATDVISLEFSYDKKLSIPQIIGEVYICLEQVKKQAFEHSKNYISEIYYVFLHGVLHLLGYVHNTSEEQRIMLELQERILAKNGIIY